MKLCGMVDIGSEAKEYIQGGQVTVNGEVETRRGRKLVEGDEFSFRGRAVKIGK